MQREIIQLNDYNRRNLPIAAPSNTTPGWPISRAVHLEASHFLFTWQIESRYGTHRRPPTLLPRFLSRRIYNTLPSVVYDSHGTRDDEKVAPGHNVSLFWKMRVPQYRITFLILDCAIIGRVVLRLMFGLRTSRDPNSRLIRYSILDVHYPFARMQCAQWHLLA